MSTRPGLRVGQRIQVDRRSLFIGEVIEATDRCVRVHLDGAPIFHWTDFHVEDDHRTEQGRNVTTTFRVIAEPPEPEYPDGWYLVRYRENDLLSWPIYREGGQWYATKDSKVALTGPFHEIRPLT